MDFNTDFEVLEERKASIDEARDILNTFMQENQHADSLIKIQVEAMLSVLQPELLE